MLNFVVAFVKCFSGVQKIVNLFIFEFHSFVNISHLRKLQTPFGLDMGCIMFHCVMFSPLGEKTKRCWAQVALVSVFTDMWAARKKQNTFSSNKRCRLAPGIFKRLLILPSWYSFFPHKCKIFFRIDTNFSKKTLFFGHPVTSFRTLTYRVCFRRSFDCA